VDALESTWISGGPYVDQLERDLAALLGVAHGIAVSSGTAALHLALLGAGIGPGDEVIVPGFTFMAPVNMVLAVGAVPVFADVDAGGWCLDPQDAARKITPKTRAVIPVHIYGNMAAMEPICSIARDHGIAVIEDAAEAIFSRQSGRYAGSIGDIGCFSFHAAKTITSGEGGFVVTDDPDIFDTLRQLRDHGTSRTRKYWHDAVGHNFRLTNVQAAIACAQLARKDEFCREREQIYRQYVAALDPLPQVRMQSFPDGVEPVVWAMPVMLEPGFNIDRDRLMQRMADAGIETRPGFYTPGAMPLYDCGPLAVADEISRNIICLPIYPGLDAAAIERVVDTFRACITGSGLARG
jgi:perosamine synthetase